jgi:hypothetical protein
MATIQPFDCNNGGTRQTSKSQDVILGLFRPNAVALAKKTAIYFSLIGIGIITTEIVYSALTKGVTAEHLSLLNDLSRFFI